MIDRTTERGVSNFSDQHLDMRVEHVGTDTMVLGVKPDGAPIDFQEHVVGLDWSQRRIVDGKQTPTTKPLSFPLTVGKTWTSDFIDPTRHGLQTSAEHHWTYKVVGWEDVTTPAGTFRALRIDGDDKIKAQFIGAAGAINGAVATGDGATVIAHTQTSGPHTGYGEVFSSFYYVPSMKCLAKMVEDTYNSENVRTNHQTDTLLSFKPAN